MTRARAYLALAATLASLSILALHRPRGARDVWRVVEAGHQRRILRDEVYCADEAFFTGTAAEVTPIRELDNRSIGSGGRGPVTAKLQALYFDTVNGRNPTKQSWLTKV